METQMPKSKTLNNHGNISSQIQKTQFLYLKKYLLGTVLAMCLIGLQILTFVNLLNAQNYLIIYCIVISMCDFTLIYSIISLLKGTQPTNISPDSQFKSKNVENLPKYIDSQNITDNIQGSNQSNRNEKTSCWFCFGKHTYEQKIKFRCYIVRKCIQKQKLKDYKIFAVCLQMVMFVQLITNILIICIKKQSYEEKLPQIFAISLLFLSITVSIFYFYPKFNKNYQQKQPKQSQNIKHERNFIQNVFINNAIMPISPIQHVIQQNTQSSILSSPHDTSLKKLIKCRSSFQFHKKQNNPTTQQSSVQHVPYIKSCETEGQINADSTRNVSQTRVLYSEVSKEPQRARTSIGLNHKIQKPIVMKQDKPLRNRRKLRTKQNQVHFFQTNSEISQKQSSINKE